VESSWVHSVLRPLIGLLCQTPGDYGDGEIRGMMGRGNGKHSEKTCPSAALSPTCCPDANPGLRCGEPATTRLSYGTASWSSKCYTLQGCLFPGGFLVTAIGHLRFSYSQYNSVNNVTISITPSLRDMFRPQTAVIRCFSYAKTVPLYRTAVANLIHLEGQISLIERH
jgi:hypothetical protein